MAGSAFVDGYLGACVAAGCGARGSSRAHPWTGALGEPPPLVMDGRDMRAMHVPPHLSSEAPISGSAHRLHTPMPAPTHAPGHPSTRGARQPARFPPARSDDPEIRTLGQTAGPTDPKPFWQRLRGFGAFGHHASSTARDGDPNAHMGAP